MKTKLTAEWKIQIRDREGKLLKQLCKNGDLILLNWKRLASAFGLLCGNQNGVVMVRENGITSAYGVYWWHYSLNVSSNLGRSGIAIVVGSSTTPPSPSDYCLGDKWGDSGEIPIAISNPSPEEWNLTVSKTFGVDTQKTLAELGIKLIEPINNSHYLLCRDVLPQSITIPAGGSVTVTYTLKSRSGG
jgi:hypothetical protein